MGRSPTTLSMLVSHLGGAGEQGSLGKGLDSRLTQGPVLVFKWFPLTVELRGPGTPLDWRTSFRDETPEKSNYVSFPYTLPRTHVAQTVLEFLIFLPLPEF